MRKRKYCSNLNYFAYLNPRMMILLGDIVPSSTAAYFQILTTGLGDTVQDAVILLNIKGDRIDIKYLKLSNE